MKLIYALVIAVIFVASIQALEDEDNARPIAQQRPFLKFRQRLKNPTLSPNKLRQMAGKLREMVHNVNDTRLSSFINSPTGNSVKNAIDTGMKRFQQLKECSTKNTKNCANLNEKLKKISQKFNMGDWKSVQQSKSMTNVVRGLFENTMKKFNGNNKPLRLRSSSGQQLGAAVPVVATAAAAEASAATANHEEVASVELPVANSVAVETPNAQVGSVAVENTPNQAENVRAQVKINLEEAPRTHEEARAVVQEIANTIEREAERIEQETDVRLPAERQVLRNVETSAPSFSQVAVQSAQTNDKTVETMNQLVEMVTDLLQTINESQTALEQERKLKTNELFSTIQAPLRVKAINANGGAGGSGGLNGEAGNGGLGGSVSLTLDLE